MLREGNQARPTVLDLRSSLEGVHGFESHPSHTIFKKYRFCRNTHEREVHTRTIENATFKISLN